MYQSVYIPLLFFSHFICFHSCCDVSGIRWCYHLPYSGVERSWWELDIDRDICTLVLLITVIQTKAFFWPIERIQKLEIFPVLIPQFSSTHNPFNCLVCNRPTCFQIHPKMLHTIKNVESQSKQFHETTVGLFNCIPMKCIRQQLCKFVRLQNANSLLFRSFSSTCIPVS